MVPPSPWNVHVPALIFSEKLRAATLVPRKFMLDSDTSHPFADQTGGHPCKQANGASPPLVTPAAHAGAVRPFRSKLAVGRSQQRQERSLLLQEGPGCRRSLRDHHGETGRHRGPQGHFRPFPQPLRSPLLQLQKRDQHSCWEGLS